ncbi:hypothetical protein PG990_012801 [Apiospora arundinis]
MPAYVPPHKLREAAGGGTAAGASDDTITRGNRSPTNTRFTTGRGDSTRGRGRGGGRGWYSSRPALVDPSELHSHFDIAHHFWPDDEEVMTSGRSSTFHDSASQVDQLAYVTLFKNANPRWGSDQIVFAKSNLGLLPDYRTQTAGKEEYFPQPGKGSTIEDGQSRPSQVWDNVSGSEEGKECRDEPGSAEAQAQLLSGLQETESRKWEEATTSSEHHAPDDDGSTATGSHPSSKSEGNERQLVGTPSMDYVPSPHTPIAVFEDLGHSEFKFAGWFSVAHVSILAPHSHDLVRMLQQKWERRNRYGNVIPLQRDPSRWRASLDYQWAVVKFEKLHPDVAPATPAIEKLPRPSKIGSEMETRGVNEILNDLRLKDKGTGSDALEQDEGHKAADQGESSSTCLSGEAGK